ncbi:ATP-binding cassette sub-family B member 10, mitochondrial [Porphyridium purpureum]|uniref:Probable ATP-dependent transporter ycf16 n=1 Tax=Porphyridium purpureum TaxID=35688 RepID=A0A5J4YR85_PORPP|nr:ATP-binding cassette sub-family B member 10, mitochondrial [Porphyridium purpureum]|eukprot:POR1464..scf236_6
MSASSGSGRAAAPRKPWAALRAKMTQPRSRRMEQPKDREAAAQQISLLQMLRISGAKPKIMLMGLLCSLVVSASNVATPTAFGVVMDAVAGGGSSEAKRSLLVLIGIYILGTFAQVAETALLRLSSETVAANLRVRLYEKLLSRRVDFFERTPSAKLNSILSNDINVLQNVLTNEVTKIIQAVLEVIVVLFLSMRLGGPTVALALLLCLPINALGAIQYQGWVRKSAQELAGKFASAMADSAEKLSNITVVRAFGLFSYAKTRYERMIAECTAVGVQQGIREGLLRGFLKNNANVTAVAMLSFCAFAPTARKLTPGNALTLVFMSINMLQNFSKLISACGEVSKALGSTTSAVQILQLPDAPAGTAIGDAEQAGGGTRASFASRTMERELRDSSETPANVWSKESAGAIRFEDFSFAYPSRLEHPALRDINLSIPAGSSVALCGPSGSGKSTLANILLNLYDKSAVRTSGRVQLDGHELESLGTDVGRLVGIVQQESALFAGTVFENIALGDAEYSSGQVDMSDERQVAALRERVEEAAASAGACEFIARLPQGYDTHVSKSALSGGQKQRVCIARVLLRNPRVIVFDEATSALDNAAQLVVLDTIQRLIDSRKYTIILISHRLRALPHVDQLIVLRHGTVAEVGTAQQLLDTPHSAFARLHALEDASITRQRYT